MSMVCGLDLHRQQITFDALDTESGEVWRGRVWQPDRERFRRWLCRDVARRADGQPVAMAVEGCTGWRYVVEEITAAGFEAHLAEPADTQAARGRKRFARRDVDLLHAQYVGDVEGDGRRVIGDGGGRERHGGGPAAVGVEGEAGGVA